MHEKDPSAVPSEDLAQQAFRTTEEALKETALRDSESSTIDAVSEQVSKQVPRP